MTAVAVPLSSNTILPDQWPDRTQKEAQPHSIRVAGDSSWAIATDLDGAVADGPVPTRETLYRALRRRGTCLLFYVTAKPWNEVRGIQQALGLPAPDVTIADSGATVRSVRFNGVLTPLQLELDASVEDPEERLRDLSYFVHPPQRTGKMRYTLFPRAGFRSEDLRAGVNDAVHDLGYSVHLDASAIHVVPRGISKGRTLLRALEWLNVNEDRVVVGGNRVLADSTLVESGLAGFALANSPTQARRVADAEKHLYLADAPFSSGVLEGLQHFGVLRGRIV